VDFSKPRYELSRSVRLTFAEGIADDASELAALHTAVAEHLTGLYGRGPWSNRTSEKSVLSAMRRSRVLVARQGGKIVGTLRLGTKKPWAIDPSYFSKSRKPLYLLAMAVLPQKQRQGLGRRCLEEAQRIARAWPADAVRLDAYDAHAGAGDFYARCGYSERGRLTYRNVALIYYELLLAQA
jgi:GNAT superfamily N-acetyltransferase